MKKIFFIWYLCLFIGCKKDGGKGCWMPWLEKHKSKLTGFYGPTLGMQETFVNAYTCSKFFIERVIIYRETSDSLIFVFI
jgi:hypothetical protein